MSVGLGAFAVAFGLVAGAVWGCLSPLVLLAVVALFLGGVSFVVTALVGLALRLVRRWRQGGTVPPVSDADRRPPGAA